MSTFVCELSVTGPVPEWGADFRVPLEQDILFDGAKAFFLAGRQTAFHLVK